MSRKTRPEKRSSGRKSIRLHSNGLVAQRFDIRTKTIACVLLASLIAGGTYAAWPSSKSDEPLTDTAGFLRNDVKSPVKNVSALSEDELAAIPTEALHPHRPEAPGYNASRGGLPPGALPPGVASPGLTDGGRTTAQGYGLNDGVRHQFTGKERDTESGLDYFGSRYYSSSQGRFTSPDELQSTSPQFALLGKGHPTKQALPNADLTNPQSLNKYHYALNNPLRYVDPDGQKPQDSFEIKMQQAIKDLNSGRITEQQYWDRLRGASVGGAAGLATILVVRGGIAGLTVLSMWATRNPNTALQFAQEAVQISSGSPAPAAIPMGFKNADEFAKFGSSLKSGLADVADDAVPLFQGSSVTGVKHTTGAAFDVGRVSDFDIAIASPTLLGKAKELGIELRSGGTRTGPLTTNQLQELGLSSLSQRLRMQAGRPVNFMIYDSIQNAAARSPSIVVR